LIILITKDLFFVPSFRAAAERLGQVLRMASSVSDDKLDCAEPEKVIAVVVDLSALPADSLSDASSQLGEKFPGVTRAAFGSHVHAGRLEQAVAAGFDPVLTRGQINKHLPQLIEQWLRNAG
jgi:hypothetical protein